MSKNKTEETPKSLEKRLKARLQFCQEHNGRSSCKNCGLCEDDIELLTHHTEQIRKEAVERIKEIEPTILVTQYFPDEDDEAISELSNGAEVMRNEILQNLTSPNNTEQD